MSNREQQPKKPDDYYTDIVKRIARVAESYVKTDEYAQQSAALTKWSLPYMSLGGLGMYRWYANLCYRNYVGWVSWGREACGNPWSLAPYMKWWKYQATCQTNVAIGQSKKEVIWTLGEGKATLYRYVSPGVTKKVPLLVAFALINGYEVLDLPDQSCIKFMLQEGYDVFLIDWGSPGQEEKDYTFYDYALRILPEAIAHVKRISGSEEFSLLGWCLGALICTIYASCRPNDGLKNLILLTAPLDFSGVDITFKKWLEHQDIEAILQQFNGLMPADLIAMGAENLKPIENSIGKYQTLWDNLNDEKKVNNWLAIQAWLRIGVPLSGGAIRQLKELYLGNSLVQGKFVVAGTQVVNLGNMLANFVAVVAKQDNLTPPNQMENAVPLIGSSDKTIIEIDGGHIFGIIGGAARKKVWPAIAAWLAARS